MTEKELQQYLLLNYPKEDERCEWKEFKNLKNDFNGKEKDDVISYASALANMEGGHLVIGVVDKTLEIVGTDTYNYNVEKACLRLKDQCANLPTEGLGVEEFITEDTNKTVWVIHVPKHTAKLPVYAHSKAFQRLNDSLIELTIARRNAILEEVSMAADWSAHIVEDATIDDLEPQALMMARFQFKKVYPDLSAEVDTWDDMKLLTHSGVASHGKLTRAALILLGKSSSSILLNPAVVQVTWILKDAEDSFMTSEKNIERHNNVIKASRKHLENVRKELSTTQELMLLAMRRDPDITIGDLSELVRISTRNVARNIKKLQALGCLQRVGGRKAGKWIVLN